MGRESTYNRFMMYTFVKTFRNALKKKYFIDLCSTPYNDVYDSSKMAPLKKLSHKLMISQSRG